MKIKIMTTEAISYVKKNIEELLPYYKNAERPEKWLREKLGKDPFVEVSALEFDDIELKVNPDKPSSDDVFNIKLLYLKMKELNDSFASDERLWAGLAHTVFYDYMLKRWPNYFEKEDLLNHFFFKLGKPRCYLVNSLSRLWWLGRKTYLSSIEDNWLILDYISHDINGYAFTLFGSNWSNSEKTLKLFMKAITKYEADSNNKVYRELFNDALKYTNCFGGIYIIDACDDDFVIGSIYNYITNRFIEREREAEFNKINNIRTSGIEKFDNIIRAINKVGGIGTITQINNAYAEIIGKDLTDAQKIYIKDSIEKNSIDCNNFDGKCIFYKLELNDKVLWKVANDYLTKDNYKIRNEFTNKQIESLEDKENLLFNILGSIRGDKISVEDIKSFQQQILLVRSDISDFDVFLKENLRLLCRKGLLEKIDKDIYKKTFTIKNRVVTV